MDVEAAPRSATPVVGVDGSSELGDQPPERLGRALAALMRCVIRTARLVASGRVRQPTRHVGDVMHFADGSTARVYRETVASGVEPVEPVVLVVEFRLRWIRGRRAHAAFRAESLFNTPLFVGFPGFVSKLWLTNDEHGSYRGLYQWDGSRSAVAYVRSLWWVLSLVSVRHSIHYVVLPGLWRDDVLRNPQMLAATGTESSEWWRLTQVDVATSAGAIHVAGRSTM